MLPIEGACLCGAVRFEVGAELGPSGSRGENAAPTKSGRYEWMAYCHCSACRKQHGALFSTSVGVAADDFRWRAGVAEIVHFRASDAFARPFCRHCGSKLPAASQVPGVINVPAGTLDGELGARPRSHIFVGSKSPLCTIADSLPQYAGYPPAYSVPTVTLPARELRSGAVLGSCLCDGVRYAIDGTLDRIAHCHCQRCRRSSGSAYRTLALVARARFLFTRADAEIASFALPHGEQYEVAFCARCGSPLPVLVEGLDGVRVPAATIDTPVAAAARCHVHVADKAPWYEIGDSLPQYPGRPPPHVLGGLFDRAP